ncbi:hypothetical protein LguiB_005563 [Lonicera macranthoides]
MAMDGDMDFDEDDMIMNAMFQQWVNMATVGSMREPDAKDLRNKPFDRATGVVAETPADAMQDLDVDLDENITSEDVIPDSLNMSQTKLP